MKKYLILLAASLNALEFTEQFREITGFSNTLYSFDLETINADQTTWLFVKDRLTDTTIASIFSQDIVENHESYGKILWLEVKDSHRRQGIARALVTCLLHLHRKKGLNYTCLSAIPLKADRGQSLQETTERLHRFYEKKLGFRAKGISGGYTHFEYPHIQNSIN